jgi:hypothetical protein
MNLLYSSSYADSLGKLTHQEQKQVKITTVDLMLDPKGSGLSLERLTGAADPNVWSARVSRGLRIILRKEGDDLLLAYVGHHDDAYAWAERRKFIQHERTGAMQIVEVIETKEEAPRYDWTQGAAAADKEAQPKSQPFWSLSDDQLLDVGVPRDWLKPVQEIAEDEIDRLFEHLPAEAAEALYDFATGGKLEDHIQEALVEGTSAFLHPDAQRRFRVVENVDELKAALDAPFEKWAIFLHPAQRKLVSKTTSGPTRVSGSAGTGKTIVALHRAVHLARTHSDSRVLLTSFSQPLADALQRKLTLLTEGDAEARNRIMVQSLNDAALALYRDAFGEPEFASDAAIRELIQVAKNKGLGSEFSVEFLFEEWDEVVDAWGLDDLPSYASVPRIGRRTRLGSKQREAAWLVFEFIRSGLAEKSSVTWAMIYNSLTAMKGSGRDAVFTHVVVDEAQDLSVAQVRFLAASAGTRSDGVFLAGDIGQRIFRMPFSWAKLGLDVRGRSHSLKVNYRTSHQIRVVADKLLPESISDIDGIEEGRLGTVSVFDGPTPQVLLFETEEQEREGVLDWLRACAHDGIDLREVGLLIRSEGQQERAQKLAMEFNRSGEDEKSLSIVTMHEAKGLEFRAVGVMACDEDVIPDTKRLASVGDIAEMESVYETERHLLYVACTRARDRLLVTGLEPGSEFLDDLG